MCARNPEQNIFEKYQVLKLQKVKRNTNFPGKKNIFGNLDSDS